MKIADIRRARLKMFVDSFDTQAVAAKMLGKPDSQIRDMIAGRKAFGEKVARAMEKHAGLNDAWLDKSDAEAYGKPNFVSDANLVTYIAQAASASEPHLVQDDRSLTPRMLAVLNWNDSPRFDSVEPAGTYLAPPECPKRAFWLVMPDDSMRETIPKGAMLLVNPDAPVEADTAYIISTPVGVICRRVKAAASGWMLIQEDNRNAPPEPLATNLRIIGAVEKMLKDRP